MKRRLPDEHVAHRRRARPRRGRPLDGPCASGTAEPTLGGEARDRARDRMAERLARRRPPAAMSVVFRRARRSDDARHLRRAQRQRARLVEDDGVDAGQVLQHARALDQDVLRRNARRSRRTMAVGMPTRAASAVVGRRGSRCPRRGCATTTRCRAPPAERPADLAIREPLRELPGCRTSRRRPPRWPARSARRPSSRPDALDPDLDLAVLDGRRGEDVIAGAALHGQGLARHGLLVHERLARDDRAVHRKRWARPATMTVARTTTRPRHGPARAVPTTRGTVARPAR